MGRSRKRKSLAKTRLSANHAEQQPNETKGSDMVQPILILITKFVFRTMTKAEYKALVHWNRFEMWFNGDPE